MRYVAIGDSFSEGVGDELPDGSVRGWTDLVAAGLSAGLAERGESLEYANLAIRGRLLRPIVTTQLEVRIQRRSDATVAWEGRADLESRADSPLASPAAAVDRLAEALFRDFPGESGQTMRVR